MRAKRVLIAPLDWGLGHATRCIPIIRILLTKNIDVLLAGNGHSLNLLHQEFPQLKTFILPAYNPSYGYGSIVWQMLKQLQKFIRVINDEHKTLKQLIKQEQIDIVISDNRYGCWSSTTPSYFITHQTNILLPRTWRGMTPFVNYFNTQQIKKFSRCIIPDTDDHFLSGILSTNISIKVDYMGVLSRFSPSPTLDVKYDILILLSGPEPQRSMLEEIVMKQIVGLEKRVLVVRGIDGVSNNLIAENIQVIDFLTSAELQEVIQHADLVISRSGYSTVMDLVRLGSKAIFIPTPGQTEQEYLAHRLREKGIVYSVSQYDINLPVDLLAAENYVGFKKISGCENSKLEIVIERMLTHQYFSEVDEL